MTTFLNEEFEEVNNFLVEQDKKGQSTMWESYATPAGTGTYKWHDHDGKKVVYESVDGTKKLYAGNGRGVDETSGQWDLIIDLASQLPYESPYGCINERSEKRFNGLRKHMLAPKKVQSEVLSLNWPDMGTLPVAVDFWLDLWKMLPEKTMAMCVGGHGRTGTCLAALLIVDGIDYYTAIDHVRTHHCDSAIESLSQTLFLHRLYMDLLKRRIATEKDAKMLADLKEDLEYSKQHVPNTYSDHGEKEPPKPPVQAKINGSESNVRKVWGDRLKLVNGQLYEQVCLDPKCAVVDGCIIADHLGWVEYDVDLHI